MVSAPLASSLLELAELLTLSLADVVGFQGIMAASVEPVDPPRDAESMPVGLSPNASDSSKTLSPPSSSCSSACLSLASSMWSSRLSPPRYANSGELPRPPSALPSDWTGGLAAVDALSPRESLLRSLGME